MKIHRLFPLVSIFLVACVVATPQPIRAPFVEREFAPYRGKGTSAIAGQAFLKTRGGEVKFGAGNEVVLVPVTGYTQEMTRMMKAHIPVTHERDPRYAAYRRTTRADGNGNFEFKDIPAGRYYVDCVIHWEVPGPYGTTSTTGGVAEAEATVGRGETAKVVLTE